MALAYLFECHFNDRTFIQQTQEDASTTTPGKNAFYDVLQRINDVVAFGVFNDDHAYVVDLRDGHFDIDGVPFKAEPFDFPTGHDQPYRLIYFKRHTHSVTLGQDGEDHTIGYYLGWQITVDGKNYQQTISTF